MEIDICAAALAPPRFSGRLVSALDHMAFEPMHATAEENPYWRESLLLTARHVPFTRRVVQAGDMIQVAGDAFTSLQIINAGTVKTVKLEANGRTQIVGLHFKGDWIGFDGIANGHYACDAYALDSSEVWSMCYQTMLQLGMQVPALTRLLHTAMGCELARHRDWRFAVGTLSAEGRVADFLRFWITSMAERNLRTDQLTLPMTRADIGSYLGLTLETVSRALTQLARLGLIRIEQRGRRNLAIPSVDALADYIKHLYNQPGPPTLQ